MKHISFAILLYATACLGQAPPIQRTPFTTNIMPTFPLKGADTTNGGSHSATNVFVSKLLTAGAINAITNVATPTLTVGGLTFSNTITGQAGSSIGGASFISVTNGFFITNAAGNLVFSVNANGIITASNLVVTTNITYTVQTSTNGEKILNVVVTDTQGNTNAFSGFTLQYNGTNMAHMPGGFGGRSGIIFGSNTYNNLGVPTLVRNSGVTGKDYLFGNGSINWGHPSLFTINSEHTISGRVNNSSLNPTLLAIESQAGESTLSLTSGGILRHAFGTQRSNLCSAPWTNWVNGGAAPVQTNDAVVRTLEGEIAVSVDGSGNGGSIQIAITNGATSITRFLGGAGGGALARTNVQFFSIDIGATNTWAFITNGTATTGNVTMRVKP